MERLISREQWQSVKLIGLITLAGLAAGIGVAFRSEIADLLGWHSPRVNVTSGQKIDSSYFLCRYLKSCK